MGGELGGSRSWGWYLAGDKILADGQGHLDGIGLVRDRGGVELDLPGAMSLVGLVDGLAEDLLMFLGAQHRADIDDLRFAAGTSEREGDEHSEKQEAHRAHRPPARLAAHRPRRDKLWCCPWS